MVHRKKYHKALWSTLPLKHLDELNIIADAMDNHIGLRYTTHMINCHSHNKGFNAVCNCTDNLELLRLQPKRTKMQNIQKGMKNEGKRKEARLRQTKQWLIILNRLLEDKE